MQPPARDKGSFSSFDSLMSDSSHRGMYTLPARRDREDKDSGYVGSEASRKTNQVPNLRYNTIFFMQEVSFFYHKECLMFINYKLDIRQVVVDKMFLWVFCAQAEWFKWTHTNVITQWCRSR